MFFLQGYWKAAQALVLSGEKEYALSRFTETFHYGHILERQMVPLLVEVVSLCTSNKGESKCECDYRILNIITFDGKGEEASAT